MPEKAIRNEKRICLFNKNSHWVTNILDPCYIRSLSVKVVNVNVALNIKTAKC